MHEIINIGVLGCANIAMRSVIPAIQCLPEYYKLVAVSSRTTEKANEFAGKFGCEAVTGYDYIVNRKDIDALYIPLPIGLHKEWINKALRAGKHVYAEKSMALSLSDAMDMTVNARSNKLALMEGYMFQYHSQHQLVFSLLKSGLIGEIRHFASRFGFPPLDGSDFRYDDKMGGGAIMDAAGYTVRSVHFILGKEYKVRAATLKFDNEKKTNIYGSAFMCNGKGIGASLSFGFDNYYQCLYEIWGQKGKITAERAFTPKCDFSPKIIVEKPEGSEIIEATPDNHFVKSLLEFYKVIINNEKREKHYSDILLQSESLDLIRKYGFQNET